MVTMKITSYFAASLRIEEKKLASVPTLLIWQDFAAVKGNAALEEKRIKLIV